MPSETQYSRCNYHCYKKKEIIKNSATITFITHVLAKPSRICVQFRTETLVIFITFLHFLYTMLSTRASIY